MASDQAGDGGPGLGSLLSGLINRARPSGGGSAKGKKPASPPPKQMSPKLAFAMGGKMARAAAGGSPGSPQRDADGGSRDLSPRIVDPGPPPDRIAQLAGEGDLYTKKIELESRRLENLQRDIANAKLKVSQASTNLSKATTSSANNAALGRKITVLENRLDKALTKYNDAAASNNQLKEQINSCRRDRVCFEKVLSALRKELMDKKKHMRQIVTGYNEANEVLNSTQAEIRRVKEMTRREQSEFESEWARLGDLIEKERARQEREDVQRKRSVLVGAKIEAAAAAAAGAGAGGGAAGSGGGAAAVGASRAVAGAGGAASSPTSPRVESLAAKVKADADQVVRDAARGAWGVLSARAKVQVSGSKVAAYEAAFKEIEEITGAQSLDGLVESFIEAEDRNFSLFSYVNQLNSEVERLDVQITELETEILRYKGQSVDSDFQRRKVLKGLEARLARIRTKTGEYHKQYKDAQSTINSLQTVVRSLFHRIGCESSHGAELLAETGITPATLMQCLGLIEQRTNEILQLYAVRTQRDKLTASHASSRVRNTAVKKSAAAILVGHGPPVPTGTINIKVPPPALVIDSSDSDDGAEEYPLSRGELDRLVAAQIAAARGQRA